MQKGDKTASGMNPTLFHLSKRRFCVLQSFNLPVDLLLQSRLTSIKQLRRKYISALARMLSRSPPCCGQLASRMAQAVVDCLEIIEFDVAQRQFMALAARLGKGGMPPATAGAVAADRRNTQPDDIDRTIGPAIPHHALPVAVPL